MKKLFKRASLILLTVCTVFACAFALSACGGSNKDYIFYIQNPDGSAYTQEVSLQICVNVCMPISDLTPDANGKVVLSQSKVNEICGSNTDVTKFSFHVILSNLSDFPVEVDGAKEYTITITNE